MLVEALKLYGVEEKRGSGDNPEILAWAREIGVKGYSADSIPWCGLFMGVVAKRAGKPLPASPLWARAWAMWGTASPAAALGDVLVFERPGGGGHVALYIGDNLTSYYCLGGNQGDAVSIVRVAKARCIAVRRFYSSGVPANVRRIKLAKAGALSVNEA